MTPPNKLGYKSYYRNFLIDDNPFNDGSDEALEWTEGFLEAERDEMLWKNAMENRENYE